jgi:hypothetical protein
MRDLDVERRLAGERADLLGSIKVPELGVIHTRARAVKRRRRMASAAAALALLGTVGGGVGILRSGPATAPPDMAASGTPPFQSVYHGSNLTMWGLTEPRLDLPGRLYTVEFADAEHGYVIAAECPGEVCELSFAVTSDGGRTWNQEQLPIDRAPARSLPVLVAFGTAHVGLIGEAVWVWNGVTWSSSEAASQQSVMSVRTGERLWMRRSDTCEPGPPYVWRATGPLARLDASLPIEACRVTSAPGGVWWVGGYVNSPSGRQPAVAVSRDGGVKWQRFELPSATGDAWAQVSSLGSDVYVSVVSPRGGDAESLALHAVYRSAAGGQFRPHGPNNGTLVGEVVPLLDGRLLVASNGWFLSTNGGPFVRDTESLPYVGRFARTPGGWLALDLFRTGYAAISRDATTWHKLNVY